MPLTVAGMATADYAVITVVKRLTDRRMFS